MKRYFFLLGFLFVTSTTFWQITEQEKQDYVDGFVAALSSQSPGPFMASALSAAPDVIKIYLYGRCNVQMQKYILLVGQKL